ncbi:MAG: hypothetical protein V3V15_09015 [Sphingorhabdus sp.]
MRLFASLFVLLAGLISVSQIIVAEARSDVRPGANLGVSGIAGQPSAGWFQVRVRQRIIIRIPRRTPKPSRIQMGAKRYKEKKIGKCIWMNQLAAVRPGAGKKQNLEFATKSGQLVRAYLSDGCVAHVFYAGAYMERSRDGKLCVDRDRVHARSGAKCEIDKFRQLVAK